MIKKLTEQQIEKFGEYKAKWLSIGLSVDKCDKEKADVLIDQLYKEHNLEPPKIKILTSSPIGCLYANYLLKKINLTQLSEQVGAQLMDQLREQVWAQVDAQVRDQVKDQLRDQVREQVGARTWEQVGDQLREQLCKQVLAQVEAQVEAQVGVQLREQLREQVGEKGGEQLREQLWDQLWEQRNNFIFGTNDASWLAFYDYFMSVVGIKLSSKFNTLLELSKLIGWAFPYKNAFIYSKKPKKIFMKNGKLHADGHAAIQYEDGFSVWALNGIRVPKEIAETKGDKKCDKVYFQFRNIKEIPPVILT